MFIDFSTPTYLISFYHISGTISFFLNTFTIWLVIFKSDKIDNFRYFLLGFQTLCTMSDFHMTFLMQPCPLLPILSGFSVGFLGKHFNVWMHYLFSALLFIVVAQLECLAFCFIRKHQTIGRMIRRHVLPTNFMTILIVYAISLSIFLLWMLFEGVIPKDQELDYINNHFPEHLSSFQSLENFAIYELNIWLISYAIFGLSTAFAGWFMYIFTTIDMFKMLNKARSKVSLASLKRHRSAVKSLLAQLATASVCLSAPLVFVIVVLLDLQYSQIIVQVLIAILALHSPINSIVLVASTPPYRNFVLQKKSIIPTATVKVTKVHSSIG